MLEQLERRCKALKVMAVLGCREDNLKVFFVPGSVINREGLPHHRKAQWQLLKSRTSTLYEVLDYQDAEEVEGEVFWERTTLTPLKIRRRKTEWSSRQTKMPAFPG